MNIFSRFLTPKWKHKKVEVRKQAILELIPGKKESQAIYSQIVQNDIESELRILAVRRLCALGIVQKIVDSDNDDRVKLIARQRLQQLLTGSNIDLDECLEIVQQTTDEKLLEHIAKSNNNLELKKAALDRIERQAFLGDLAINDNSSTIRMAALERITQRSTLARVAKKSRTIDKKISTIAKERVAVLVAEAERPERLKSEAKQCAKDLSLLIRANKSNRQWEQTNYRYEALLSTWHKLEAEWNDGNYGVWNEQLDDRFTELCNEYSRELLAQRQKESERLAYEAKHAPMRAVIIELCETLEAMVSNYSEHSSPDFDDLKLIEQYLDTTKIKWKELQSNVPEDTALYSLRFEQACEKLNIYSKEIGLYIQAKNKALDLLEKISIENSSQHLNSRKIEGLERRWNDLKRPLGFKLENSLVESVTKGLLELREKFKQQEIRYKENAHAFELLVDEIGVALNKGEVRHAAALVNQGRKKLAKLPERNLKSLVNQKKTHHFQKYVVKLNELQSWHDWSSHPVKERLCQEMEQLADEVERNQGNSDYDLGEVARLVRAARDEWKTTGASDDKKIWERFNDACSRAYEPCKNYFDIQSQQRQQNLRQKEAICDGLEKYADLQAVQIEQGDVDWIAAEKIIRTAQKEWRETGFVDRKYLKVINGRFRKVMNQLRNTAKANRLENKNKKLELIKQSEEILAELNEEKLDIQQAISKIKIIQSEWKCVGHALDDRELWKKLRVICDDLFARRDAKNSEINQEQLNNLTAKEVLCDEIESLVNSNVESIKTNYEKFKELKGKWKQIGDIPKNNLKISIQRFEDVCQKFETNYKNHINKQYQEQKKQLKLKHKICNDLEELLGEVVSTNIEKADLLDKILVIDRQWNETESQSSPINTAIVKRYKNTMSYLEMYQNGEDIAAEINAYNQSNKLVKEELCLRLEILAGVESPDEAKQARMQYQVAIMADEMKSSEKKDNKTTLEEIENSWYSTGFVEYKSNKQLEKRFFSALEHYPQSQQAF